MLDSSSKVRGARSSTYHQALSFVAPRNTSHYDRSLPSLPAVHQGHRHLALAVSLGVPRARLAPDQGDSGLLMGQLESQLDWGAQSKGSKGMRLRLVPQRSGPCSGGGGSCALRLRSGSPTGSNPLSIGASPELNSEPWSSETRPTHQRAQTDVLHVIAADLRDASGRGALKLVGQKHKLELLARHTVFIKQTNIEWDCF